MTPPKPLPKLDMHNEQDDLRSMAGKLYNFRTTEPKCSRLKQQSMACHTLGTLEDFLMLYD
jgi:hypothetical protein